MSNSEYRGRQIKIRPIEMIVPPAQDNSNLEELQDENEAVQQKLSNANEALKQAEQQRNILLAETQQMIETEKKNWESLKEDYKQKAYEEGFQEGFSSGKEESISEYKQLLDKANQIIGSAEADYHHTIEQSEDMIADLAVYISETIIKQKINEDKAAFFSIVKAAINEIKDQSMVTIYIHPDQYNFILQQKEELIQILPADTKLTIYTKTDMGETDCLIEHPFGQIDASIKTQLEQLRKVLHELTMGNEI